MKALTIWQPWASLIMAGAKPYEFRGWQVPGYVRNQRIAIHAGARAIKRGELADLICRLNSDDAWSTCLVKDKALPLLERWHTSPHLLPRASVLGTAIIGEGVRSLDLVGEFGGVVNDSDRDEHCNYGWPLTSIEVFEPFRPAKGLQGFWNWSDA